MGNGAGAARPLSILHVEDNPTDRMLLQGQFRSDSEILLKHFDRLQQALSVLGTMSFDLALIDLNLPDSQGLQTYKKVRAVAPDLPVIVVTGSYDPMEASSLPRLGVEDYLLKDGLSPDILMRTVRYAIERAKLKSELDRRLREIARSERRLRNLLDTNTDAVLTLEDGIVRFANPAAAAMFGRTVEDLEGSELGIPSLTSDLVEIDILRRDGTLGIAEMRIGEIHWDGKDMVLASLRDVTDRARREEALREREATLCRGEAHLALAQRLSAVGSFEVELDTMTTWCSVELRNIFAFGADEEPDWPTLLARMPDEGERTKFYAVLDAAANGNHHTRVEFQFRRDGDGIRQGLLRTDIIRTADGAPRALIGIVRDITELREAQRRQKEIEEQLQHAQRLDALGTLAGGIAHDLNNTLTPITTLGSFLLKNAKDEAIRRQASLIVKAADRAGGLVREVLNFSRKQPIAQEPLRLDMLVEDTLVMLRAGLKSNIDMDVEIESVPEINGNKGQLYQIVLNLVTNAAQAIGARPGKIVIAVGEALSEEDDGPMACLSITDDGDGMDEETQKRIFEPFFTTKSASEGTGLGMSVVRGIVTSHGGVISVASEKGRGTRFDVKFPLAP